MEEVSYKPQQDYNSKIDTPVVQKEDSLNPIWIAKNREQVIKKAAATGASKIIYEVPAGKTLFISSLFLSFDGIVAPPGISYLSQNSSSTTDIIIQIARPGGSYFGETWLNFSPQLRFRSGQKIYLTSTDATIVAVSIIIGWLEPNSNS